MLKIKRVERYTIPRYPRAVYRKHPDFINLAAPRGALAAAVMAFLLEACDGFGGRTTGVPAIDPRALTETEARELISHVFSSDSISLIPNVELSIETAPGDTATLNVDGYNDSLRVGYEYLYEADYDAFTTEVRETLDSLIGESGPYVQTIDSTLWRDVDFLNAVTREFIDSLRASGAI